MYLYNICGENVGKIRSCDSNEREEGKKIHSIHIKS